MEALVTGLLFSGRGRRRVATAPSAPPANGALSSAAVSAAASAEGDGKPDKVSLHL